MNNKVTFSDAKVGDRVWSITNGWGVVKDRRTPYYHYPLNVKFEDGSCRLYTLWGRLHIEDQNPTLFWDEFVINAPAKPLPDLEVDTKVLVWNNSKAHAQNAHFCCFEDGKIYTYKYGRTSFTKVPGDNLAGWDNWELSE